MNEQLELLESQLSEMSAVKRIGIYITIVAALLFMSWNFFGEPLYHDIERERHAIASLEHKLQQRGTHSLERAISKCRNKILTLQDDLTNVHFKNQFLRTKLESIGFILYSQEGAAQILDDLLKQSVNHGITIDLIESEKKEHSYVPYIQEKSQIHVTGNGSFKSIIALMQYIDSLNVLMRTQSVIIGIDDNNATRFDMNLSHYGVEL